MTGSSVKRCRACGAPILFARAVGDTSRRPNPIDARPSERGNIRLFADGRYVVLGSGEVDAYRLAGTPLYISHFVTCPEAGRFRAARLVVHVQERLLAVVLAVALTVVLLADVAHADEAVPVDPPATELLEPVPEPELVAPPGSKCPDLYPVVVEHWPNAALHWPLLDKIFWRESRCRPDVVNRYGCVGLMQICRINHRRLGVTRYDLIDPATNIEIGYQLCIEQTNRRRSCWRPWWIGRWRP